MLVYPSGVGPALRTSYLRLYTPTPRNARRISIYDRGMTPRDPRTNLTPGRTPGDPALVARPLTIRLAPDLRRRLDDRAAIDGVRVTTIVVAALTAYLDDQCGSSR